MRTLAGPSLFAPFAASSPSLPSRHRWRPAGRTLPEVIRARLPETVMARIQTLERSAPFETLVAGLAQALQDWHGPNNLPCQTSRTHRVEGWYIWDITMSRRQRKPCNWVMN